MIASYKKANAMMSELPCHLSKRLDPVESICGEPLKSGRCMNSVELILLKCIPRGHPNPFSRVGLSCSIFKNTSATCAYPHACAQGTFSYTPCSRRGLTKKYIRKHIFFVRHLLVHAMFEKGPYEKIYT